MDIVELKSAEIIRHCQNVSVQADKPCTITVKIKMIPDEYKSKFSTEITATTTMSPKKAEKGLLYSKINEDGSVGVVEFNPNQMRIDFAKEP